MIVRWQDHVVTDVKTFKDKRVIVRVDWNMPTRDGVISDTSRLDLTVPFLKELSFAGAKIIILSHFGEKGESLQPVADYAKKHLSFITFNPSLDFNELGIAVGDMHTGDAILLENVRMWKGETENLPSLARSFSELGDIFINNAFSVSHREHASVVGIAKNMLSYLGPTCVRELEHLTPALTPTQPALLIVGGAKIATKLALIEHYLNQGVQVFVGGAMVHTIWKARGVAIGNSLYDANYQLSETLLNHPLLITPKDVVLATGETVPFNEIPSDGVVVDCGEETAKMLEDVITNSKTIIMNGPLGLYEKGWLRGSEYILVEVSKSTATTYIGGGDTVSVAHSLHLLNKFHFVSLGGGAMLDFLANGTLPGINAVTK